MKTVGLCMIVKNEARVIARCLASVRPLIDYALIEDTGSTDGTQDIIRDWLDQENLPGEVFEEPWQDFAHNRSVALGRLRERAEVDYALIIDADDILVCEEGFRPEAFKAGLHADLYHVAVRLGPIRHYRSQICSNRLEFHYRGVLHEFITGPASCLSSTATGFHIQAAIEGARSGDPDKYRKDAAVLERALQTEEDPLLRSRYTFYLANSWKDCGEAEKALTAYLARAGLGFWEEEVFISLYCAAQIKVGLGHPDYEVIGMFLRAYEACPWRAEALHGAARYCRATGKHQQGHMLAKQGLEIEEPASGLFLEPWIYEYGLLDEFAVNAYWVERYNDCLDACERLLRDGKMPEQKRERVEMNARFAREKLALQRPMALPLSEPVRERTPGISVHANEGTESKHDFFRTSDHAGCFYTEFIARLHQCLRPRTYLEIGTLTGSTLALALSDSIAVDPQFTIDTNVVGKKNSCLLFQMTSDAFFEKYNPKILLGSPVDLAFLDGMHWFEFLLRDFMNTEAHCKSNSVILMHDCMPTDAYVGRREFADTANLHLTSHKEWWAGDVWKTVAIIKKYRPDLEIHSFDAVPTGLVAVTNLDPTSDVLKRNYSDVVREYSEDARHETLEVFLGTLNIRHTEDFISCSAIANLFWM